VDSKTEEEIMERSYLYKLGIMILRELVMAY
jgi:hypothetical protein